MKKFIAVFLAALIALSMLSLGGCGWFMEALSEATDELEQEIEQMAEEEEEVETEDRKVVGLAYNIPKDFEMSKEESTATEQIFYLEDYLSGDSDDSTCIIVSHEYYEDFVEAGDESGYFDDAIEEDIKESYEEALGEDVEVEVLQFEMTEISGYETLHYEMTFTSEDMAMSTNVYEVVVGNDCMGYVLMQPLEFDHTKDFEKSAERMTPIYEDELGEITGSYEKVVDLEYTIPKGFKYSEAVSTDQIDVYIVAKTGSSINVIERDSSNGFYDVTEELLEENSEREIDSFEKTKVAGFDAYRVEYEPIESDGVELVNVQYMVNVDGDFYVYTLAQFGDDEWIDIFDDMIADIEPIYE